MVKFINALGNNWVPIVIIVCVISGLIYSKGACLGQYGSCRQTHMNKCMEISTDIDACARTSVIICGNDE